MIEFPKKKYKIILIDPAWKYKENWGNGAVRHHYKSMNFEDIKKLPIKNITDENCHLYLWVTCPFIQEGLELIKEWGFEYKQIITWVKTKNGKSMMGLGYYFRVCTEHCLFAIKGKLPRLRKDLKNVIFAEQTKHSKKPDMFYSIIIKHSGNLSRIELFARQKIEGWDAWGNEVPKEEQRLLNGKR